VKKLNDEFMEYLERQIRQLKQLSLDPRYGEKLKVVQGKVLPTAKKMLKSEKVTKEDVLKAMSITCYGNLAYCCGLEKKCPWRDMARAALRIDDETFRSKEDWVWSVLKGI